MASATRSSGVLFPISRASVGIDRDIDDDLAEKCTVAVEHLDALYCPDLRRRHSLAHPRPYAVGRSVVTDPGLLPGSPHDLSQLPFLSTLAIRELTYPSLM